MSNKFFLKNSLEFCKEGLESANGNIDKMLKNGEFFANGDLEESEEKLEIIILRATDLLQRLGKFRQVKNQINKI